MPQVMVMKHNGYDTQMVGHKKMLWISPQLSVTTNRSKELDTNLWDLFPIFLWNYIVK